MAQLNVQNPNLYAKMRALIQKAFSIMKPNLDEALGIRTDIVKKGQTSPFFITLLSRSKPRFDYLINRYRHVYIEKLPESKDCKHLMESDRAVSNYVNKYVGTSRGLVWIWTSTYVDYILEKIVERYFYEQKDDPELFDSLFYDFEKLCYDGYLPIRDIAPLHNFTVSDLKTNVKLSEIITHGIESFTFKPIQLDHNLRIKKITNEDNRELFNLMQSNHLSLFEVGEPEFAIECEVNEPLIRQIKKPDSNIIKKYQSEDTIDAVVTGLRLFRSWFVGYSNIFPLKKLNVLLEMKHKAKNIIRENELGTPYKIDQNDLQEFQEFWNDYGHILQEIHENKSNWSALNNAIVHFNSSYTRSYARDKLIDLSVSVEALFRDKSRIGGDISHRNALRMARFIVNSNIERQEIYEKMKKLSIERNSAVHASNQEQFDYQCLEEFVRQALKKYLELVKNNPSITHEEIINSLDYD